MKRLLLLVLFSMTCIFFFVSQANVHAFGEKKRRLKPDEYGKVVIDNYSTKSGKVAPVVFQHWLHRARYTCRLCHVDIGFAMKAGGTQITEEDNKNGLYCGACHNGGEAFGPQETDKQGKVVRNCDRCHSFGKKVAFKYDFYSFKKRFPRGRFGNGIDWMKAEEEKLITLKDYLPGVSIKRKEIQAPADFDIAAKEAKMPEIIFSHKKHTIWCGCELCHPEIFPIRKEEAPYSMQDIFDGKYCGLCHDKVAFPNIDCQRCHTKAVY